LIDLFLVAKGQASRTSCILMTRSSPGICDINRLWLSCVCHLAYLLQKKSLNLFWLANLLTMSVHDEGYSSNASYALNTR